MSIQKQGKLRPMPHQRIRISNTLISSIMVQYTHGYLTTTTKTKIAHKEPTHSTSAQQQTMAYWKKINIGKRTS
jgi:hypothetical protein